MSQGEKSVHRLADGFPIEPLYTAAPARAGRLRDEHGWLLAPSLVAAEPAFAALWREEVAGGAEALFVDGASAESFALPEMIGVQSIGFERSAPEVVCAAREADPEHVAWLGLDPVVHGFALVARLVSEYGRPGCVPAVIDSRRWEGSAADELGLALSAGLALGGHLEAHGIELADALRSVLWTVPLGTDFLLQTAKLRALRRLWARVLELTKASADSSPALLIRGVASPRWATVRDPWVNLLRNTAATFAGAIGGVDLLTPLPYDAALGASDADARRLARNTVHLLEHEAQLGRVADLAAGAYAIETWTEQLAARAWGLAQEIEARGGFEAAQASGFITERLAATHAKTVARASKRQDAIIGTSLYPNLAEVRPSRRARALEAPPLSLVPRLSEPFEHLRNVGAARHETVALVTLGSPAEHLARLGFARGFYEVAGLATAEIADGPELVARVVATGARRAVLCGTDAAYVQSVPRLAPLLAQARLRVTVAGRAGEREASYRGAGVSSFIYAGIDLLATLTAELLPTATMPEAP